MNQKILKRHLKKIINSPFSDWSYRMDQYLSENADETVSRYGAFMIKTREGLIRGEISIKVDRKSGI